MTATTIEALCNPGALGDRLTVALRSCARKRIAVGLAVGDNSACAATGEEGDPPPCSFRIPVRLGCTTKLFTGSLIKQLIAAGRIELDTNACELLPFGRYTPITIRHLLEHTHGLDDSMLESAPRTASGHIDSVSLCKQLRSVAALTAPGTLYSYSNAGAWLNAAILERIHGRRYVELLRDLPACIAADADVCPALGGSATLPLAALLGFLTEQFVQTAPADTDSWLTNTAAVVAMPGWNVLERGVRLGWKYCGSGWFGHSSMSPGALLMIRVHPQRRIGLVIASRDQAPATIAAHVFGRLLPEIVAVRTPREIDPVAQRLDLDRYAGTYVNASLTLCIRTIRPHSLELTYLRNGILSAVVPLTIALRTAQDNILLSRPQSASLPYVQCLLDSSGSAAYLWDGQRILPKAQS